ncbi:MarR family winged helix-turn-helix transcriptional regulator [Chelatococcus reniformis]|nr:MarR family transcriptional regulator [Chelatococcus reniformis]
MTSSDETVRRGLGPLLALTARLWRRAVDRGLEPFGLTEATWLPLIRLARAPGAMHQKELADSLSLDSSAVVRLLDALQEAGLVERREGIDRRTKAIVLTPAGQAMVEHVEDSSHRVRDDALVGVSDEDLATTSRVLQHICRTLAAEEAAA